MAVISLVIAFSQPHKQVELNSPVINKPELEVIPKLEVKLHKPIAIMQTAQIKRPTPKPLNATVSGNKSVWMQKAGIPQSDLKYADYIVSRESGWNPSAVNASSGACGLAQALPCSKLGPNWSNPIVALKWQKSYVNARYGGYAQAYAFWTQNHWY